jgi:hypothetical protein
MAHVYAAVPTYVPAPAPAHGLAATRAAVRQQIEYYFSLENLIKDNYLRSKLDSEGWVDVAVRLFILLFLSLSLSHKCV